MVKSLFLSYIYFKQLNDSDNDIYLDGGYIAYVIYTTNMIFTPNADVMVNSFS